jgi:hypothetical protein
MIQISEPMARKRVQDASELIANALGLRRSSETFTGDFSWEALEQAANLRPAPEDVYCTLSVRLIEVCAPVLTSDAVTTTV